MKLTQTQLIFALLIDQTTKAPQYRKLLAPHDFMGELFIKKLNTHYFISYEASARLSELFKSTTDLLYREKITGKSGAKYYGYRINDITLAVGNEKLQEVVRLLSPRT